MKLFTELKRRNVLRMAALYVVSAWFALQVVDVLGNILPWPPWTGQFVLMVLAVGFPIALVISWFYEITAAGVSRETDVPAGAVAAHARGRGKDFVIISVLCAAVLLFAYDKWWPQDPVDRSIVVLPFQNLSNDPEQEYFSDGIAEDTLDLLAGIQSFKVIAWTTARTYRDRAVDIATVASELNVSHVLEGSVRKSGNRVRIMVQLINGADNTHVWSQPFDRELTADNIFEVQKEIATTIAARLRTTLTDEERERLEKVPTHNLEAYSAYLKAKQGIARSTTESLLDAAEFLRKAIELDPMYAEAHAALAETYWNYEAMTFGKLPEGVTKETAGSLISRALELDPGNGFSHAMRGKWLASKGDPGAELEFNRALELSPNNPDVYLLYGRFIEDRVQKFEMYRQGLQLDPMSPRLNSSMGSGMLWSGQPDEAVKYYTRVIESDPESVAGYWGRGVVNWWFTGRLDEAMRWFRTGFSKDPGDVNNGALIGWTYLWLNDDVTAEKWFRYAMAIATDELFGTWGIIDVYHVRGWHEEEWELIEETPSAWWRAVRHLVDDQRYEEARDRLMSEFPEVFAKDPEDTSEYESAVGNQLGQRIEENVLAARILMGLGDQDRAAKLLAAAESYVATRVRSDPWDYTAYAKLYAALGRNDDAIEALRKGIDGGAYGFWPLALSDSDYDPIRNGPEFQQIRKEIEAKMAIQLERVRDMERNGEIPMLPEEI